mmetsp:Transcript_17737/g.55919  ORF Transcript_17737/g.55919 Transcript_17737/m.55919 type:complete len:315 (+) Transcript_17737:95-1039(+)
MADAPSLQDFLAKKTKKKIKGSNLNVVAASKPDPKAAKKKDAEAEGWQEEEVVAATMKVEVAGKLQREEDKKEDEDAGGRAWGSAKSKSDSAAGLNERKFPTLAKSVRTSTNINIDDGSQATVNISTSKNVFAALENEEDDEEQEAKRPKEIKPAMVTKKKGEREKVAIQREVDKYSSKKDAGKKGEEDEEDDEEADEDKDEEAEDKKAEEQAERKAEAKKAAKKAKAEASKEEDEDKAPAQEEEEVAADLRIIADVEAAQAKYVGRKKPFPPVPLPRSEQQEEKENKPVQQGKKKKMVCVEETDKPKLQYWEG